VTEIGHELNSAILLYVERRKYFLAFSEELEQAHTLINMYNNETRCRQQAIGGSIADDRDVDLW